MDRRARQRQPLGAHPHCRGLEGIQTREPPADRQRMGATAVQKLVVFQTWRLFKLADFLVADEVDEKYREVQRTLLLARYFVAHRHHMLEVQH